MTETLRVVLQFDRDFASTTELLRFAGQVAEFIEEVEGLGVKVESTVNINGVVVHLPATLDPFLPNPKPGTLEFDMEHP
jgi:hypothetical protein